MVEILAAAAVIGLFPAFIAQRKGYSFAFWWLFGAALFIVALPYALLMGQNPETRQPCPWCRTSIDRQARVCPTCSRDVFEFYAQGLGERPAPPDDLRPWERA